MKNYKIIIMSLALLMGCVNSLSAQQEVIYQNRSQGFLAGYNASIDITCTCIHQNDPSYDTQKCNGEILAGGYRYTLAYKGYISTPPYEGIMGTPTGNIKVGILSSTGGKFKIYSGKATLGPPEVYGEFIANWRRIR